VAAWLFRIAHNTVANYHRDQRASQSPGDMTDETPDPRPSPEEYFAQAEDGARARTLVASLPEKEQEIVSLRVYAGLTSAEIGAIMGMRAGAVRMHLHRALKKLGAHFSSEEPA
jgi:RNA polymerase sigma-70 factor (ECF subfamily)